MPLIDSNKPVLLYNSYNLDPNWKKEVKANRILLLEPSIFEQYPISDKSVSFMLDLGKNIEGLQLFTGAFAALESLIPGGEIYYKEHPLNRHYKGTCEPRDWMTTVTGYFPSFFGFWKRAQKEIF